MTAEYPVISANPLVQSAYEEMRRLGESHNIAEMLALRTAPGLVTDSTFLSGHCNGNQFADSPKIGDYYRRQAKKHGMTDTEGKVYLSGLARFPGDPQAWVSGRGDVNRVCRKNGWSCRGSVNVKGSRYKDPVPDVPIADDLVKEDVDRMIEQNPGLESKRAELTEQVREELTPSWYKKQ